MYGTPEYVPLSLPKVPGAFDNQKLANVLLDEITKYKSTYDISRKRQSCSGKICNVLRTLKRVKLSFVKDFHKHMKDYAGNRYCIIYNLIIEGAGRCKYAPEDMF